MSQLTWDQALAWRLQRHHLHERAQPRDVLQVIAGVCGLHAQLMSSAELSLWARVEGNNRELLQDLLWRRRELVKLWAMRGTLHLLPASELGLWISALGTYTDRGMTRHPEIDSLVEAIGEALEGRVLTREELALEVQRITGDEQNAEYVRFSWGSNIKPGSFRGLLCFAENDGNLVRFTSPASWVPGGIQLGDTQQALRAVTRRALSAYGPLTAADLALWWGGYGPARGRRMLAALGDEAVEIDIGGEQLWMLVNDVEELLAVEMSSTVRLLPAFDPWVAGASRDAPALLSPKHRARVFRAQGWISPVVLLNGRMVGVWKHKRQGRRLKVEVETFARLPRWARSDLEEEVSRLRDFLGGELTLTWTG